MLKKGDVFYKHGHKTDIKCHVVSIIKDRNVELVVWKWYKKRWDSWEYGIEELDYMKICFESKILYSWKRKR